MTTEPKAAFAGVILATSFARLRPSIARPNVERTPSRPFGCWDLSVMVEMRGGYGETEVVRKNRSTERPSRYSAPRLTNGMIEESRQTRCTRSAEFSKRLGGMAEVSISTMTVRNVLYEGAGYSGNGKGSINDQEVFRFRGPPQPLLSCFRRTTHCSQML